MATQIDIDEVDGICGGLGAWERIKVELYRYALREAGCCQVCEDALAARLPQDERLLAPRTFVFCGECGDKRCPHGRHHEDACAANALEADMEPSTSNW